MCLIYCSSVQWKVQGGSPEGTLAWVRQKGCFGADDKVVLASAGRKNLETLWMLHGEVTYRELNCPRRILAKQRRQNHLPRVTIPASISITVTSGPFRA